MLYSFDVHQPNGKTLTGDFYATREESIEAANAYIYEYLEDHTQSGNSFFLNSRCTQVVQVEIQNGGQT